MLIYKPTLEECMTIPDTGFVGPRANSNGVSVSDGECVHVTKETNVTQRINAIRTCYCF